MFLGKLKVKEKIMKDSIEYLLRKKVESIFIDSEEQRYLKIITGRNVFVFEAVGDCCSESWFADLTGIQSLIGSTITRIEEVRLDEVDNSRTRQDVDEGYSIKIKSTGGYAEIVYRNSSNGYYGGYLNVISEEPKDIKWMELTKNEYSF